MEFCKKITIFNINIKSLYLIIGVIFSFSCFGQSSSSKTKFLTQIDSIAKFETQIAKSITNRKIDTSSPKFKNKGIAVLSQKPAANRPLNNVNCFDTSSQFSISKDSMDFYVQNSILTKDGNILIVGSFGQFINTVYVLKGLLIKCDLKGNTLWAKLYDSVNHAPSSSLVYSIVTELIDGTLMICGSTNDLPSGDNDLVVTKADGSGNVLWTKSYYSRLWINYLSTNYHYIFQLQQDPFTSEIYIMGNSWNDGTEILKLDVNNGNILWSNTYKLVGNHPSIDNAAGIIIKANEIVSFSTNTDANVTLHIYRINKTNGDTIQTKVLALIDTPSQYLSFLTKNPIKVLLNGEYALSGSLSGANQPAFDGTNPLYQAGVIKLDNNLDFKSGYVFRNSIPFLNLVNFILYQDGSGLMTMTNMLSNYSGEIFYTQFRDNLILRERKRSFNNERFAGNNFSIQLKEGGDLLLRSISDSIKLNKKIIFSKLHLTDTASLCLGIDTSISFTQPVHYGRQGFANFDSVLKSVYYERQNKNIASENITLSLPMVYCDQISICDTLKLISDADTICLQTPLVFHIHKNPLCGAIIKFNFDTSVVQSFTKLNDTTYQLLFRNTWRGYISGSLFGCKEYSDSFLLTVLNAPPLLKLVPDTNICPGNKILLNAHKGFATYRWQDGSTDSVYTVTQPGIYHVTTTSPCGIQFSDTVLVTLHPPIAFSLGNDIDICKKDTAIIIAPLGFMNYLWSYLTYTNLNLGDTARIRPDADLDIFVKAEKTTGCFAYDTIKIIVHQYPAINLGADTSFCAGITIVLDAGSGFSQYQWNTGATSRQISVNSPGKYIVTGSTLNGCKSSDSLNIVQVFNNPSVNLGTDTILCKGKQRVLDAGAFNQYLWNTGSTNRLLNISDTGLYIVHITDVNNCSGYASLHVANFINPPVSFLSSDTAICSYGEVLLKANNVYASYLWNNGQTSASILITQPGIYWLQATDTYGCVGKDSLIVLQKECMKGLYVPTAFSPNFDGKNDLFKTQIFGNLISFQFLVYNRYGQNIFSSSNQSKGWDGTVNGVLQNTGGFTWVCHYQFAGENPKVKSGNVVLIR